MAMTLFGSSFGYKPEQPEFANLSSIAVGQKFRKLTDDGFANNQESVVAAIEGLHNEGYEFEKLNPAALALIDRKCDSVGLNRKHVVQELERQVAQFRDNFRPSSVPRNT